MTNFFRRFTSNNSHLGDEQDPPGSEGSSAQPNHELDIFPERPLSHQNSEQNQLRTISSEEHAPHLRLDTSRSTSNIIFSEGASPAERPTDNVEDLKALQSKVPTTLEKRPTEPQPNLFDKFPSCTVILPIIDEPLKYCTLLLHDSCQDEKSLRNLARRLQQRLKSCLFILLRGPEMIHLADDHRRGYCWNKSDHENGLFWSCGYLLENIILKRLIHECHFRPRDIVILGHGQGAIVALRAVTIWNDIEFGGVIAVGSPPLFEKHVVPGGKAKTPIMIVGSGLEERNSSAVEYLRNIFSFVDISHRLAKNEDPPTGLQEIKGVKGESDTNLEIDRYLDFLVHRLRRDEWRKQDIISFDGGGIRGYGSLLILEALMEKIVVEETSQDQTLSQDQKAKSSFHPCDFKPTKALSTDQTNPKTAFSSPGRADSGNVEVNRFEDHPKQSARFLPCHYFTYAAGTSTGGLISIMIHRLRMPIDECIKEYEDLGEMVFGRPRLPILNKIQPKFDHKNLENAINGVCSRHSEALGPQAWGKLNYVTSLKIDEKDMLCRCMVLAISHQGARRKLYPFRTYPTPNARNAKNKAATNIQKIRGYGPPSTLPVWQVARATSAAPGYFEPITIERADGVEHVFKDGGFGHNNPSLEMYNDIKHKHGEENIGVFVSIGTGETEINLETARNHIRDTLSNLLVAMKLPTMTGPVHRQMEDYCKENKNFLYARLDGGKDLGKMKMDEWKTHKLKRFRNGGNKPGGKTLEKIRNVVSIYLSQESVRKELEALAKCLVERRRLRIRDPSEWDRFASFSYYTCDFDRCPQESRTADEFREHISKEHKGTIESEVDQALRQGRRYDWVYHQKS